MMKQQIQMLLLTTLCILCAACGGRTSQTPTPIPTAVNLNVFAAASLTDPFKALATQYQKAHPDTIIKYNFAGSLALEQQIANGASADVFASADVANMKKASDAGLVGTSQIFARNKLVVVIPASNPGGITTLKDLAKKGIKLDFGTPTLPIGAYGRQILDKMAQSADYGPAYKNAVLGNIVSQEDNVKAVVQKVQLGEADAGFVYQTDVSPAIASMIKIIAIPDNFNVIAQYPVAVVKNAAHASQAQAFVQYLLSADGQAILTSYHFTGKS